MRTQHDATLRKEFQAEGPTSSGSLLRTSCRVCSAGRTGRKQRRRKRQKGKQGSLLTCHSGCCSGWGRTYSPSPGVCPFPQYSSPQPSSPLTFSPLTACLKALSPGLAPTSALHTCLWLPGWLPPAAHYCSWRGSLRAVQQLSSRVWLLLPPAQGRWELKTGDEVGFTGAAPRHRAWNPKGSQNSLPSGSRFPQPWVEKTPLCVWVPDSKFPLFPISTPKLVACSLSSFSFFN